MGRIINARHLQVCHEHWLESILQQCREDHSEYNADPKFVLSLSVSNLCLECMKEPWLLHDFDEDFYGEELRLAIFGYIRPEVL